MIFFRIPRERFSDVALLVGTLMICMPIAWPRPSPPPRGDPRGDGLPSVTLLVYGLQGQFYLQSLVFTASGFDLGVRDAMKRFGGFNISLIYVPTADILVCQDTAAYFDRVSHYYYTQFLPQTPSSSIAIIYPGCDESTTLAQLGREWNALVMTTGTIYSNLRDRVLFPTTVALGPRQYEIYGVFLIRLFAKFNWTSVGLIYDISDRVSFNRIVSSRIQAYLRRNAPSVQLHSFPLDCGVGKKETDYAEVESRKMGWDHGEIAWISMDVPQNSLGPLLWQMHDTNDEIALASFRSVFKLESCARKPTAKYDALLEEFRTRSERIYNVTFAPNAGVLVQSLNASNKIGNGRDIAQRFLNTTFDDPAAGDMFVDDAGERQRPLCLADFDMEFRTFREVLSYLRGKSLNEIDRVGNNSIDWSTPDGKPPPNEPFCGFRNEKSACRDQGYIVNIAAILTTLACCLIIAGTALTYRRNRIDPDWWRVAQNHLNSMECQLISR
ncbi:hypothetical protein BV898_14051 [Hypsibius exemplaris]|uniref:Receptor ligand binding region domain-containing protein n=1 Tax=Hypsibius exemplaris TaxID=2072580 RepID=A0A1W0W8V1_HYPEX|nr:hypothetical protein BV898_14051 [Hypsibius exemplaris]